MVILQYVFRVNKGFVHVALVITPLEIYPKEMITRRKSYWHIYHSITYNS